MKHYPSDWPNRKLIGPLTKIIDDEIQQEITEQSARGNNLWLLKVRVSWRQTTAMITGNDIARFFIKVANKIKSPLRVFASGVNNIEVQPNAHYHSVIGVVLPKDNSPIDYNGVIQKIKSSTKHGIADVQVYSTEQLPYNTIDYIIGKHDWVMLKDERFTPRKESKLA